MASPRQAVTTISANAAWLEGGELRRDVVVVCEGGRVSDVVPRSKAPTSTPAMGIHEVPLLLPGLINAHVHLEYTSLAGLLPRGPEVDFGKWIEAINRARRLQQADTVSVEAAVREGVRQSAAGGATTLIDVATSGRVMRALAGVPLRHLVLHEMLGLDDNKAALAVMEADRSLAQAPTRLDESSTRRPRLPVQLGQGISPHAPYSVGAGLRRRLLTFLNRHEGLPTGWHLGETTAEVALLRDGTGPLADFLKRNQLGTPFGDAGPPGLSPVAFLREEGLLDRCDLAFHLNHATLGEAAEFAAPRAIVHCPGTHSWFGRAPFPMAEYLGTGANMCLGTDSRASSESLSMIDALRMAANAFPSLGAGELIDLATRNPAATLAHLCPSMNGEDGKPLLGRIAPGAAADFTALSCKGLNEMGLREILADPTTALAGLFVNGDRVI